ncbi:hypothetical protein ACLOJK_031360 [Asimina triloba]
MAGQIGGEIKQYLKVTRSLKIVLTSRQPFVEVKLDMAKIEALQMKISAYTVAQSILQHPKTKLKQEHVEIVSSSKLKVFPPEADKNSLRFKMHFLTKMLVDVIVKGIPTVERAVINHEKEKNKYSLLVEGTNLQAVMGIPGVDGRKTKSNHIIEVEQTLGIEAARRSIIDEIQYTMKGHGMSIDVRHMMLLADVMTFKGQVLGITNTGIAKMKDSVLMLASFEKTGDHLFNASLRGRVDQIEGVSECIIMGIPMQIGTGILKVKQRNHSQDLLLKLWIDVETAAADHISLRWAGASPYMAPNLVLASHVTDLPSGVAHRRIPLQHRHLLVSDVFLSDLFHSLFSAELVGFSNTVRLPIFFVLRAASDHPAGPVVSKDRRSCMHGAQSLMHALRQ